MLTPISILYGTVAHGKGLGASMGMPTANLTCPAAALPPCGVYTSLVLISEKQYLAVTNIGPRPTVDNDTHVTVEAHILDFAGDLYDQKITLICYERLRDTQGFESVEKLQAQFARDCADTRAWYAQK